MAVCERCMATFQHWWTGKDLTPGPTLCQKCLRGAPAPYKPPTPKGTSMLHTFLDIETLDTANTAVVLEIAAVTVHTDQLEANITPVDFFKMITGNDFLTRFQVSLPVQEQLDMGRTISASTLEFWSRPENASYFHELLERSSRKGRLASMFSAVMYNVHENLPDRIWCNGPHFDCAILDSLAAPLHVQRLPYRLIRDVRTFKDTMEEDVIEQVHKALKPVMTPHNALHDAAKDATMFHVALQNGCYVPMRKG